MKDPHDTRSFRRWQKIAADGTVLAVVELEAAIEPTSPDAEGNTYVEIL